MNIRLYITGYNGGQKDLFSADGINPYFNCIPVEMKGMNACRDTYFNGEKIYSFGTVASGIVFSTTTIVFDPTRGMGNFTISIFLPKHLKLTGAELKQLLDELSNQFIHQYCPPPTYEFNLITTSSNEWIIPYKKILASYEEKLQIENSHIHNDISKNEPAFLACSDDEKLINILNSPFHEEFQGHQMIHLVLQEQYIKNVNGKLFIDEFTHNGHAISFDLGDKKYYFKRIDELKSSNQFGLKLRAFKTNKWEEIDFNNDNHFIKAKWPLKIECNIPGYNLNIDDGNIDSPEIRKLFVFKDRYIYPNINKSDLQPISKVVRFQIRGNGSDDLSATEIVIPEKKARLNCNDPFEFSGDDFNTSFVIYAENKTLNKRSPDKTYNPENGPNQIEFLLELYREIKLTILTEHGEDLIYDYTYEIKELGNNSFTNKTTKDGDKLYFFGGDIYKPFEISVKGKIGNNYYSIKRVFDLKHLENSKLELKCKKEAKKQYSINLGDHGKWKNRQIAYSEDPEGKDIIDSVKVKRNYTFSNPPFLFNPSKDEIIAQYRKKKIPIFSILKFFFFVSIILSSALFIFYKINSEPNPETSAAQNSKTNEKAENSSDGNLQGKKSSNEDTIGSELKKADSTKPQPTGSNPPPNPESIRKEVMELLKSTNFTLPQISAYKPALNNTEKKIYECKKKFIENDKHNQFITLLNEISQNETLLNTPLYFAIKKIVEDSNFDITPPNKKEMLGNQN